MKVVILAGGYGTRLSEFTKSIPKPMVSIGGRPILLNIMEIYSKYGHKDFYLALGYKAEVVKEYFLNYRTLNSDFTIDLESGIINIHKDDNYDWKVTMVQTGSNSMTGGRIKRLKDFIGNETFLLTYGDSLANININKLIEFHYNHGKKVTVTAVHPDARFGELNINGSIVKSFQEKPQTNQGWVNGGYFVVNPEFLDYIDNDNTILEKTPLERVANEGELMAYKHTGFWQCMDTKRDKDLLESYCEKGLAPWM